MRVLTLEWIEKAEGDYNTALRESRARKSPNYDAACFHCQQCAEKYLKALLQERCVSDFPEIELHRDALTVLDRYAVIFRYPGERAIKSDAQSALKMLREFRKFARNQLDLD